MTTPWGWPRQEYREELTSKQLQRIFTQYATFEKLSQDLFQGSIKTRRSLAAELSSYVSQGLEYYRTAEETSGQSAALLLYYSMLNFAKAELLVWNPSLVTGMKLRHGLVHHPLSKRSLKSEYVEKSTGVFDLLYEKRTGYTLSDGYDLRIARLLANIPELGTEIASLGIALPASCPVYNVVAGNSTHAWTYLGYHPFFNILRGSTGKHILKHFEPITDANIVGRYPHALFNLSGRHIGVSRLSLLQLRNPIKTSTALPTIDEIFQISEQSRLLLEPLSERAYDESTEGIISPSLYQSELVPMPSSLARYVVIFYLSSLVRYRPSSLSVSQSPELSWLSEAVCGQAGPLMLLDFLSQLTSTTHAFYSRSAYRT